jgi:hypothetical protein
VCAQDAARSISTGEEHGAGPPGVVSLPRCDIRPNAKTLGDGACPALRYTDHAVVLFRHVLECALRADEAAAGGEPISRGMRTVALARTP